MQFLFVCLFGFSFFYFCRLVTLCSSLCLTKSPSLRCSFYTRSVTDLCQLTYINRWLKRRHTEPLFPQLCILIRKSSNDSIILVLKTLCPKLLLTVIFIYLFFTLMPQIFLDSLLLGGKDIRFLWETLGQVSSRNAHIMRYPERYLFRLHCCLTYFSSSAVCLSERMEKTRTMTDFKR